MDLREEIEKAMAEAKYATCPGYFIEDVEGTEIIREKIVSQTRWMTYHEAIVKYEGKLYAVVYDTGSTEMQDSSGEFDCYEVEAKEVTVIKYVKKK